MERALASIQIIKEIRPIEGADLIEETVVLGWHLVVQKGEFKVGEKCVYFECDSMLPLTPAFEFLKTQMKQYEGGGWFCRLRTKKLRGVLSQGLALPLGTFGLDQNLPLGEDVSERLGIKKYEPQIPAMLRGWAKGNFPTLYIPKTDEIRIQSIPEIFDEIRGKVVYVTEKADGTSATYFVREVWESWDGAVSRSNFGVCSRNLELKEDDKVAYWIWAKKNDIEGKLRSLHKNIAFQGELCGPGIQKNRLGLQEFEVFFFNIWDIDERRYFNFNEFCDTIDWLGLNRVKVIKEPVFDWTLEELLEMAKGKYEGTKNNREGIVIRPVEETYSEVLKGRLSFKVLNTDYLLREEE